LKITLISKTDNNNKIRKPRAKKIYKVLDDIIVQKKFKFFQTDILYPLFVSIQKKIDLNFIVPFIESGQYNTFVDVMFTTGNLYFFLNLPKNILNIPNLPAYCFYKVLKRGEGGKIEQYLSNPVNTFNKHTYKNMKDNIKQLLTQYEQHFNDP
jgi:hypothetical protein